MARKNKVFVSGCFDMLHSGHVRFLEEAARFGELHVGIGSDETVHDLKGRYPVNTQEERQYMIEALRHVKSCRINAGSGVMDFLAELKRVAPDVFVVNEDGNTPAKSRLCRDLGIRYVVLKRKPRQDLPVRSTTLLRKECRIPYRLDLAGGWLDQPFVSKHAAGPVLTISIEPTIEFNERSGMASSSRRRAIELWQTDLPGGDPGKTARMLFSFENPPGTKEFSGSQDSIGIVFPGLNRLDYAGEYWPRKIKSVQDEKILSWLEQKIHLIPLGPRRPGFRVLRGTRITAARARALACAADGCWKAILKRDVVEMGRQFRASFEAQISMFPGMVDREVRKAIEQYGPKSLGWKLSGAGGGGYLVLISDGEVAGSIRLKIRRKSA
ncbi:MAG TPA: adenylyltransferase/cytidyltransferase family protein [Verrucomicrobiota bacterium]|nr:adenylyltransferase/cytidyltransferase family protein [Verrucomicrobiota bacterium]